LKQGKNFDEIVSDVNHYMKHTHLLILLESVKNFASNGRISPVLAKSASVFGVRIVGRASEQGDVEPFKIVRGAKKALNLLYEEIIKKGYHGDKMILCHTQNEKGAQILKDKLLESYPNADIQICEDKGLCSYYLEAGGIMAGFEDEHF
ncbi:MAG: DegV family protein, partial [Traorella sp.]